MPREMPAKYSHALLAVGLVLVAGPQLYTGELSAFLLFLLSPFLLFSFAAAIAKRNIIIRFTVVLGALFLVVDILAFLSTFGASSTAPIGLAVLVFLQSVVALAVLVAAFVAGRVHLRGRPNGTV